MAALQKNVRFETAFSDSPTGNRAIEPLSGRIFVAFLSKLAKPSGVIVLDNLMLNSRNVKIASFVFSAVLLFLGRGLEAGQESGSNISEPVEYWTVRVNGTCSYSYVITGNLVIISVTDGTTEHLEARRVSDGALAWTNAVGGAIGYGYAKTIVVSSRNLIFALDSASGKELWRFVSKSTGNFSAPSVLDGKNLYIADYCPDPQRQDAVGPSNFYCLEAETGQELWHVTLPTGVIAAPVSFDNDNIYVVREYGMSCISKRTHSILWSKNTHTLRAPSVPSDGFVVIPTHGLDCLSARDGVARWTIQGGLNAYGLNIERGIIYTALPLHLPDDPRSLTFVSYFAAIRAETGDILWKRPFSDAVRGGSAIDSNKIYLTCWDNNLYCLDIRDGRVLWRYHIDLKGWAPTPLLSGKTVLLCFQDRIICIGQNDRDPTQIRRRQ